MKNALLFLTVLYSSIAFSQKKVEVNKSSIEVDGQIIAEYDGKGGVLSGNRKIWVLSPATKDTLLIIYPMSTSMNIPLIEWDILYKLCFYNAEKTTVYFKNPKGWGSVKESKVVGLFFNEQVPLVIENGKLSEPGIGAFREKVGYDAPGLFKNAQQVIDSVIATSAKTVDRQKANSIEFKPVGKNYIPRFYQIEQPAYQTFEIWQDGVLIGALEKQIETGSFAKGIYNFYKKVAPFKVGGLDIKFIPVAFSETSPNINREPTSTAGINLYYIQNSFKLQKIYWESAENSTVNALIGKGIL
jgi:hypothetical protein